MSWETEAAAIAALEPRHVLLLCVANSARSQLAEGLARSMAPFRDVRDELRRRLEKVFAAKR